MEFKDQAEGDSRCKLPWENKKIGMRNVTVATAVYNYRFYFESLGIKHLEIPTCCSREE